jgi:hypothetical protein
MSILKNKWKEMHNNSNNNYNKDRKRIWDKLIKPMKNIKTNVYLKNNYKNHCKMHIKSINFCNKNIKHK